METFFTIYKVTNKLNGKTYIGSHKTKDLNDGYMGSGKYLKHAIAKHGLENFEKEVLFTFDNAPEMYAKEAELVNEDYLVEANTYNLKVGGFGGFDYLNSDEYENPTHSTDHSKMMYEQRKKTYPNGTNTRKMTRVAPCEYCGKYFAYKAKGPTKYCSRSCAVTVNNKGTIRNIGKLSSKVAVTVC